MYNHILQFIEERCGVLISITQKELKGTNFDIPVNCIWGTTTQAILEKIPVILTAGITDEFHRNYMDTMQFVSKIEELCGSRKSLARLRSQENYQLFMKRWKLQTYFQLRFREISQPVEDALQSSIDASQRSSTSDGRKGLSKYDCASNIDSVEGVNPSLLTVQVALLFFSHLQFICRSVWRLFKRLSGAGHPMCSFTGFHTVSGSSRFSSWHVIPSGSRPI